MQSLIFRKVSGLTEKYVSEKGHLEALELNLKSFDAKFDFLQSKWAN